MRSRAISMGVLVAILGGFACGGDDGGEDPPPSSNCPKLEACGGDPVGDWKVGGICVENPEAFVRSLVNNSACNDVVKSTRDIEGDGTYNLKADKTGNSEITVSAVGEFAFTDACVKALSIGNSAATDCAKVQAELDKQESVASASCTASGALCNCTVMSEQTLAFMGAYSVSGSNVMVNNTTQAFCVSGNTMKVKTTSNQVTVTLDLTK